MFLYFSGRMPQLSRLSGISRCGRISVAAMMRGAAGYTGFFYLGDLIEYDKTANIFQNAKLQSTNDYVTGHFG